VVHGTTVGSLNVAATGTFSGAAGCATGNLFLAAGDRLVLLLLRKAGDFGRGGDGNFAGSDGRLKFLRPFLLDLFGGLD
jgi:hypothetical protein